MGVLVEGDKVGIVTQRIFVYISNMVFWLFSEWSDTYLKHSIT